MKWILLVAILTMIVPVWGQELRAESPSEDVKVKNEALRQKLVAMGREDQAARIGALQALKKHGFAMGDGSGLKDPKAQQILKSENKKTALVDEKNRQRLQEIIDAHGWPGKSLAGRDGALAAWLIVQHADADVKFQKRCLELLETARAGEVEIQHIALLTDRVLVNEDKPQRYGTQMGENFEPRPIEDPEGVDERRAEMGLPPLAEYLKNAKEMYEKMASGSLEEGPARE